MLRSLKEFERYEVDATDGDVGTVANFLLDDTSWAVRYLIAKTNGFFDSRKVLVTPVSFREVDGSNRRFHLGLTKEKVKNSPNIDLDQSVSRQHERDYYRYYGYPYYWGGAGLWGAGYHPGALALGGWEEERPVRTADRGDPHLRSASELRGYHIEGSDGEIGHVADFIVDDASWAVRYLVVDTSNWFFGKKVLIAPHWAQRVSYADQKVVVGMSRAQIKGSPTWNPEDSINREYETRLYDYYGRPTYWSSEGHLIDRPPNPEVHAR